MSSLFDSIKDWDALGKDKQALARALLQTDGQPRYALGRNEYSRLLPQAVPLDGFIDDSADTQASWQGLPVVRTADVPANAFVVNCATIRPHTAAARLAQQGIEKIVAYADICKVAPERLPLPVFVGQTRQDVERNRQRWEWLHDSLADEESRAVLRDVLRYRLTGDPRCTQGYRFRPEEQYFEAFLGLPDTPVFVDGGGFDGDNSEGFCQRYPDYRRVYLFEPEPGSLRQAKNRLAAYRDIVYVQQGLSDSPGTLRFDPGQGSASTICETGSLAIAVTPLDAIVEEPVDFIKMDLEGWEIRALRGAEAQIRRNNPTLAIAVYHEPADFWKVAELLRAWTRDYSLYLRHYTEGWTETIMYFVPRGT